MENLHVPPSPLPCGWPLFDKRHPISENLELDTGRAGEFLQGNSSGPLLLKQKQQPRFEWENSRLGLQNCWQLSAIFAPSVYTKANVHLVWTEDLLGMRERFRSVCLELYQRHLNESSVSRSTISWNLKTEVRWFLFIPERSFVQTTALSSFTLFNPHIVSFSSCIYGDCLLVDLQSYGQIYPFCLSRLTELLSLFLSCFQRLQTHK